MRALQCGRIYKDAEMQGRQGEGVARPPGFNVAASIKMRKCLLSGRPQNVGGLLLQCGRIYKDAEIFFVAPRKGEAKIRFNVAASIKMRK